MTRLLLTLAAVLASTSAAAQVPYTETFSTDGKGVAGPCVPGTAPTDCATQDFGSVDWTLSGDFSGMEATDDFFQTSAGALEGQDLGGEVCWNSPQITASGTVALAFDLEETGDHEASDFFNVLYSVDGGLYTQVPNVQGGAGTETLVGDFDAVGNPDDGDFGAVTVSVPSLSVTSTVDLRVCAENGASSERMYIREVRVTSGAAAQTVTLAVSPADGGAIEEAAAGSPRSTSFTVTLSTSDGNPTEAEVTADVILVSGTNSGDFTPTVDGSPAMSPIGLTFAAATANGATRTIAFTAEDDLESEGTEAFQTELQNVTGATVSGAGTFDFSILDDDEVAATNVRINEIRIAQSGSDVDEYVELSGTPGSLDGLTYLVIGDNTSGGGGALEEVTALDGSSIPADGYFFMADPTFSLGGTPDLETSLQFEDEDVTHLLVSGFTGSNGDDLDTNDDGVLDVTPWTSVVDAVGIVETPVGGDLYYGEVLGFDDVGPNGTFLPGHIYRNETTGTFQIGVFDAAAASAEDTPGAANPTAVGQAGFADQAGYRLLGLPITTGTASDLAELNLIQGVPGQYEAAAPSVYVDYDGTDFLALASASADIPPGQGFFMYFFDVDVDPPNAAAGGGTSRSFDLAAFDFSLSGTFPATDVPYTAPTLNGSTVEDGAYMIGNPFPDPFDLFGVIQAGGDGMLSRTFQAWDPTLLGGAGDYVPLDASSDDVAFIDVFQGVVASVSYASAPTTPPTFDFAFGEVDAGATPGFYGRRPAPLAVGLDLTGEATSGTTLGDGTADLWFREAASLGPDRVDAAELPRPGEEYASLALVEDGSFRSVRGVPLVFDGPLETPVAFRTTTAGTFTVGFDPEGRLPEGLTATLRDRETGLTYTPGETVTFTSDPTEWTARFTLLVRGQVVAAEEETKARLQVGEVFPNPSAGRARISLEVDAPQRVTVTVIDAIGRRVGTVRDADLAAGTAVEVTLPADLAPGAYVVRVAGDSFVQTRRLVVVR